MRENELFDLESKQNKAGGGYCKRNCLIISLRLFFLILTVPPGDCGCADT